MTFTNEPPKTPGFYAWKKTKDHWPLAAYVHLAPICGLHVEFSNGSEGHPERCGGQWCRLVPAEEVRVAFNEGLDLAFSSEQSSEKNWEVSRAKKVMEGLE